MDAMKDVGNTDEERNAYMRSDIQLRRDVIRAAFTQNEVASNPEADKIIGKMLLERVEKAIRARSLTDWELLAQSASEGIGGNRDELSAEAKEWLDTSRPVITLGFDALSRSEEQNHRTWIEAARQAAAQTPGSNLRVTEIDHDTVISDETILGPNPGEEDEPGRGVTDLDFSLQAILGLDDSRTQAAVERVSIAQGKLIEARYGESAALSAETVRLAVAQNTLEQAQVDLAIADVIEDLPTPIQNLGPEHFPALRGQLLTAQSLVLTEGSIYSRTRLGDRTAWATMNQLIIATDMLASATPYFLPHDQIPTAPPSGEAMRGLPAERTFLVWHDNPVGIDEEIHALACVFSTDSNGELEEVAHMVRVHDGNELEISWVSMRAGRAAEGARAVASALVTHAWNKAKKLRLPGKPESSAWTKGLVKFRGRARRGGFHSLHTLAGSE